MKAVVHPYINFGGNCSEAIDYYVQHLDAKLLMKMTFAQAPPDVPTMGMAKDQIMHAHIQIGEGHIMLSDAPNAIYQPMRSAYNMLGVFSNEDAEKAHKALADGGEVFMNLAETFFAHRFSMLRDKFGVNWIVIHGKQPPAAQ